jgi:hypothetical protein
VHANDPNDQLNKKLLRVNPGSLPREVNAAR